MSSTPDRIQTPQGKTRLIKHFEGSQVEQHNDGWKNLWDTDNSDMWDRGKPSPALIDLLEERMDIVSPVGPNGQRKKVLVPGCGKGYDVVMLALHGFDVVGLELSSKGAAVAEMYARNELQMPQEYNFGLEASKKSDPGSVSFIQGDFFQPDSARGQKFDIIYDYTFLCALHPEMRAKWAARMADLLVPGGLLICLEFPLFKDPSLPGPPWPLKDVYWSLLAEGGDGIVYPPKVEPPVGTGAFERKWYIKPERSYESGQGADMLSVYVKK